jgi:EAL and modified HD-GYP domain-containing signal transduction protein
MHVFVARQPIFDRKNQVIGYEMLFRSGCENNYNNIDGNAATLNVIANSFYEFNFKSLTDNKKAFINFTEKLIMEEVAMILPCEHVVIELLENIEPTDEIINACKKLKKQGFILALDDFVFDKKYNELIKIIDIIKVDFIITKGNDRKKIFDLLKINNKIKFLAEKVESIEEYNEAMDVGYDYFQGYYFSKPTILTAKSIPTSKYAGGEILKLINNKNFDYRELEALILKDVGLSYKILRLINSSAFYIRNRVNSIKYAITFLGEKEIVKWLYVVLLNDLKGSNSGEIIKISLQTAKLCELICKISINKEKAFLAYITGLFSTMDAILNCSIESIITDLNICDEVKEGLIGEGNILNTILRLSTSYGRGEWEEAEFYAEKLNIDIDEVSKLYLETLKWVDNIEGD